MKTTRNLSLAGVLAIFLALPAIAGDGDADLRRAAKLQRNGETPAATAIWKRWAERGNADAAYNLAVIHQHGDGVARDHAEALRWYRHAARLGDRISEYQIGLMYLNGEGVAADPEEAHRWLTGHRQHHVHHGHDEKMQAWRKQAAALIEASDRREALAKSRANDTQVLAELRRRAAESAVPRRIAAADETKVAN